MFPSQQEFDIRCEWGENGVALLAPVSDVIIIVDVLSFSTSVAIAVDQGAIVFPYRSRGEDAEKFALSVDAQLADPGRAKGKYSLSPESLMTVPPGTRIVLPSPNGATLSLLAESTPVLAGCLRNAQAVALAAMKYGPKVTLIPAGERWRNDNTLRPSFEDLVGAGAIISGLAGSLSPEAKIAVAAFQAARPQLDEHLLHCSSGKELIERGFLGDVQLASQLNVSNTVPVLKGNAFVRAEVQA